jgi:guanylate kinase
MSILKELEKLKDEPEKIHVNPFEDFPHALIFLIAGVSGVGKSTAVRAIVRTTIANKVIVFVITHTNRSPRNNPESGMEVHGVNYFFVSTEEFLRLKELGYFAEYEEVYEGRFYGTSYNQLYEVAKTYGFGITDIDVRGAKALKALFPNNVHTIFMKPESKEQAISQLRSRAEAESISEKEIVTRIERFEYEFSEAEHFDSEVISVSGDRQAAFNRITEIMAREITKRLPKTEGK